MTRMLPRRLLSALTFTVVAQAAMYAQAPASATIPPPTPGLLLEYHYWPEQFVQFVGTELPYSLIEVDVAPAGKTSIVDVTLTMRADRKRLHYTNSDVVAAAAAAQGMEAHKVNLAWEEADTQTVGSTSTLRMSLADGKPLEWRFVQGSDISEQGAGVTAIPESPIPILMYREQAGVAGEGTALKVGNVTSAADVWKEISQPPYFIAYHGALSLSAHTLVLGAGKEAWTVARGPSSLAAGGVWELAGVGDRRRVLKIVKADGAHVTLEISDTAFPSIHATMEATRTADAWQVDHIRFAPDKAGDKHFVTVGLTASDLDVTVGKKAKIATASLAVTGETADRTTTVTMQTPAWAKGKTLSEESMDTPASLTTISHP